MPGLPRPERAELEIASAFGRCDVTLQDHRRATLLWTAALTGEDRGDNLSGFILLEVLTAIPLVFCITRLSQVRRIRRLSRVPLSEQVDRVNKERDVDDALGHLDRLVARLPAQVQDDVGREALAAAARSAVEWRKLLRRASDLRALLHATGADGRAELSERLASTEADAETMRADVDRLASALAAVADARDDDDLATVTARIELAEERMLLFAEAMAELRDSATPEP